MAKSSSSFENEVYNDSFCSKSCRKNTDSLNPKITKLNEALSDSKTNLYHNKLGLSQVEARLVEFKTQEIKLCEKIRGLEFDVKNKNTKIENLMNELEQIKKEKEGYSVVPPPAQVYSPPKKDMSWIGLPEFADNTITDYNRPSPTDCAEVKTNKDEAARKPSIKYAKVYRNTSKSLKVRGKSWPKNNHTYKGMSPRTVFHKSGRTPIRTYRTNTNVAQPKRTSFAKTTHLYVRRPFQRKSTDKAQFQVLRVSTVNTKFLTVDSKFSTVKSISAADLGNKGKAVKASAC
nr:hypothetical protein [Tanacetum cinerariifolium]